MAQRHHQATQLSMCISQNAGNKLIYWKSIMAFGKLERLDSRSYIPKTQYQRKACQQWDSMKMLQLEMNCCQNNIGDYTFCVSTCNFLLSTVFSFALCRQSSWNKDWILSSTSFRDNSSECLINSLGTFSSTTQVDLKTCKSKTQVVKFVKGKANGGFCRKDAPSHYYYYYTIKMHGLMTPTPTKCLHIHLFGHPVQA